MPKLELDADSYEVSCLMRLIYDRMVVIQHSPRTPELIQEMTILGGLTMKLGPIIQDGLAYKKA